MLGFYPLGAAPLGGVLNQGYNLPADAASFAFVGQDVGLYRGYFISADAVSFALTGQDVEITVTARSLTVEAGAFVLSGRPTGVLLKQRRMQASVTAITPSLMQASVTAITPSLRAY